MGRGFFSARFALAQMFVTLHRGCFDHSIVAIFQTFKIRVDAGLEVHDVSGHEGLSIHFEFSADDNGEFMGFLVYVPWLGISLLV